MICTGCKGNGWLPHPSIIDDSLICPYCDGTGYEIDVQNFETFSYKEYVDKLKSLNIGEFRDLVGEKIFYVKKAYGIHTVVSWDSKNGEYLITLDGDKYAFWTNPFKILKYDD